VFFILILHRFVLDDLRKSIFAQFSLNCQRVTGSVSATKQKKEEMEKKNLERERERRNFLTLSGREREE